ncbi:hypothetical protein [Candidatus Skiveiella danica]|uniref:hypothetical protein n=1 Tax=Candidatus Skiveiella danica TaxID=3386177 RepID=UPI001DB08B70|nr:hypothetical protein [Betaproteobacteria bacterium]
MLHLIGIDPVPHGFVHQARRFEQPLREHSNAAVSPAARPDIGSATTHAAADAGETIAPGFGRLPDR